MSTFIKIAFGNILKSLPNTAGFNIWVTGKSNPNSKSIPQSHYYLLTAVLLNSLIEFVQITVTATGHYKQLINMQNSSLYLPRRYPSISLALCSAGPRFCLSRTSFKSNSVGSCVKN